MTEGSVRLATRPEQRYRSLAMPRTPPALTALSLSATLLWAFVHVGCVETQRRSALPGPPEPPPLDVTMIEHMERARVTPRAFEPALATSNDVAIRARATLALARLEHLNATPLLFVGSRDPAPLVRRQAAFGLGLLDGAISNDYELHHQIRRGIERRLVVWLSGEPDQSVRLAIVRSLGRISGEQGVEALLQASMRDELKAAALYALGVAGARRGPLLRASSHLRTVVESALASGDLETQRAAAYVAFRQQVPLDASVYATAATRLDVEARVHLARAWRESTLTSREVESQLEDPEWRVRVELLRGVLVHARRGDPPSLEALLETGHTAVTGLISGARAESHVVGELCEVLGDRSFPAAPGALLGVVEDILNALSTSTADVGVARCRCAVARAALSNEIDVVGRCGLGAEVSRHLLMVDALQQMRLSTQERIGGLTHLASDDDIAVRLAVARALLADGSRHAGRLAVTRLREETAPVVAATLLAVFEDAPHLLLEAPLLHDVVYRFRRGRTAEELAPVFVAIKLAKQRTGAVDGELDALLRDHPDARVRSALDEIPFGERPLPRALQAPRVRSPQPPSLPIGATLHTTRGKIELRLLTDEAPYTVTHFAALVASRVYEGVGFHRLLPGFIVQTGASGAASLGTAALEVPCENHDEPFRRGAVAMALSGKDTGSTQFFVTYGEQPHLEATSTQFAQVIQGMAIFDELTAGDRLLSIELVYAPTQPSRTEP